MYARTALGPIRPPSEAYSLLIRVTENCPWNRCEFCSVFKGQKFAVRPIEDVEDDIHSVLRTVEDCYRWAERGGVTVGQIARLNGFLWLHDEGVVSAFLQDSDALVARTEPLAGIVELLYRTFPTLQRVCSYSRAKTVFRKTPEDLKRLHDAGLSRVHIGLETGDDELLEYVQKGATAAEQIEAGKKAVAAGFEVSEYVMPGLGGRERWQQHAQNSARVLNEIDPHFIRLRSFHPAPGTPIYEKVRDGELTVQSLEGMLVEVRAFVEALEVNSQLVVSDFAWNSFIGESDGKLPEEKDQVLASIDRALAFRRAWREAKRNPLLGNLNPPAE
jgi:radical SAM superfamily enzyme YgiQ (UPF0313 family)